MKHFIDEAKHKEEQVRKKEVINEHQQSEAEKENHVQYEQFHKTLTYLIYTVNQLSPESRKPIVEIGSTHLPDDNIYEYYSSSYQTVVRKTLFFFKKEKIYNWWRRIIVEITSTPDEIYIKLHEKGTSETNINDVIKKKLKIKVKISKLTPDIAVWMIDYLGYTISNHELISILKQKANRNSIE